MKRVWILALIALAGCGSDPVVRAAGPPPSSIETQSAPPMPTGCVPGRYSTEVLYGPGQDGKYTPETQSPAAGIARHLYSIAWLAPTKAALDEASQTFEATFAANAESGEPWVVSTDELGNRVVADAVKDGRIPDHYLLEDAAGEDLMQFHLSEAAPGHWYVSESGSC